MHMSKGTIESGGEETIMKFIHKHGQLQFN